MIASHAMQILRATSSIPANDTDRGQRLLGGVLQSTAGRAKPILTPTDINQTMQMKTRYFITVLIVATLTTLTSGCSKSARQQASDTPSTAKPSTTASKDLGVVELSDGVPSQHDLGEGRVCTVTPAIQKDGSVLMTLKIEQDGQLLAPLKVKTLPDRQVTV